MISYISGTLASLNPAFAIIEANGIGYGLFISLQTYTLIQNHQSTKLFTESVYIRDDNPKHYGFAT